MNKIEFMAELERLLADVAPAEREEALQYYRDYFEDAGEENEEAVIKELGSPKQVADNIRSEAKKAEDVYRTQAKPEDRQLTEYGKTPQNTYQSYRTDAEKKTSKAPWATWPTWLIVVCITIAALTSPVWFAICIGITAVAFGISVAFLAVFLAFGITAVALIIVFGALLVVGITCMGTEPLVGIAIIGAGFICGAVGIAFLMITVAVFGLAIPGIIKGISSLFGKKKRA